jgi:5-methylcytosine-specific restriction endonuclease McrA
MIRNEALPGWFRAWQKQFYNSLRWTRLRDEVRVDGRMRCACCGHLIRGKSIVDHISEITPDNYDDENVTLNRDNLQLLCLACHNSKATREINFDFDMDLRKDINLF